jgi:hypothetical protein
MKVPVQKGKIEANVKTQGMNTHRENLVEGHKQNAERRSYQQMTLMEPKGRKK